VRVPAHAATELEEARSRPLGGGAPVTPPGGAIPATHPGGRGRGCAGGRRGGSEGQAGAGGGGGAVAGGGRWCYCCCCWCWESGGMPGDAGTLRCHQPLAARPLASPPPSASEYGHKYCRKSTVVKVLYVPYKQVHLYRIDSTGASGGMSHRHRASASSGLFTGYGLFPWVQGVCGRGRHERTAATF